jgi:hypothetical protein
MMPLKKIDQFYAKKEESKKLALKHISVVTYGLWNKQLLVWHY